MNEELKKEHVRRRFGMEQRRQLLEAFTQRQEPAVEFARRHGVATSTLHRWAKVEKAGGSRRKTPLEFREVHVTGPAAGSWTGEVSLPNGATVRWNGAAGLAGIEGLLAQLRRPC